jgi:signal transduction histidine kinase
MCSRTQQNLAGPVTPSSVRSHNPTENRIVIEVTDIGIGIEPEILPKVFDAFEQVDSTSMRQYSGLGLGLMISRVIVKAQ